MFDAFARLVAWFYDLVPSYGVAIILLTITVRLVLFPLTAKQARSMQKMQQVQPELKRLQAKYKNDRQKLNEEMMKFYKENQINPLAGCLPLLLQMPLFLVLYQVISGLTKTVVAGALIVSAVGVGDLADPVLPREKLELSGGKIVDGRVDGAKMKNVEVRVDDERVGAIREARIVKGRVATATVFDGERQVGTIRDIEVQGGQIEGKPKYIPRDTKLSEDLRAAGGEMKSFGMDLAKSASDAHDNFFKAFPFYLLIALVVGTGYFQQRQMTAKNPQAAANPQAQLMGKIFPAFFGVISLSIPAGVVVYFVASNLWQIGQQAIIFRGNPSSPAKGGSGGGGGGGGGGGKSDDSGGGGGKRRGATSASGNGAGTAGGKNRSKPINAKSTPTSGAKARPKGNPRKGR